ncbi:hypothetical protein SUGI_0093240 [Cryptomeria japonica]|uniref:uncharacterized protein LOC131072473 n=1 Tax=Cryptomeria japonica TaxID=3369 RepID=UPI002408C7BD|nr:uncharacterized protein LOC131072473 [Cryptomeria japonica]GLJ08665.1 hypothetical protein SUGI_0093240 [Cryptomeria japonica]
MEIFKWTEVVSSNRRNRGFWLIFGVLAGFSAVVFALALCARNALRHGVRKEEDEGTASAWLHWPGWSAVKNGGAAEGGGGEILRGPQRLYALIRNNGSFSERVRTGDVAGAKRQGVNQTGIPVWQRRILMGERCRLPDYSGLILYDQYGNPLPQNPDRLQNVMN